MSSSSARKKQGACGFTLIELLVVIAVIGLLTSILFPVFARARENARRSACMSNMKQIGLGLLQYTQDFDERMPASGSQSARFMEPGEAGWQINYLYRIQPYVGTTSVYACPSAQATTDVTKPSVLSATNYGGNGVVLRSSGLSISSIPSTESIIFLDEVGGLINYSTLRPAQGNDPQINTCAAANQFTFWHYNDGSKETYHVQHFAGGNLLFCDGHAKWRKATALRAADFGLADGTSGSPQGLATDTISAPSAACYASAFN